MTETAVTPAIAIEIGSHRQVVFIDAGLADTRALAAGVPPGAEIVWVGQAAPAIAQMAGWAVGKWGYEAIHILSHGEAGVLLLGNARIDAAALRAHRTELATLGKALCASGDILLYGCDVATGSKGARFVDLMALYSGADVAASVDATGAADLGGNWTLAYRTGPIDTPTLGADGSIAYGGLLAAPVSENFDGVAVDGFGWSQSTQGQPRTINGWTFNLLDGVGNTDPTGTVDITYLTDQTSLANGSTDKAAYINSYFAAGTGTDAAAVFQAKDGDAFSFTSVRVEVGGSNGSDYRLVGYLDGVAVAGASQDFVAGAFGSGGTLVSVTDPAWRFVDEVRIVRQNGEVDISVFIDDIVATAADTTPPTASIVVADSALAIGETALVTITFSEAVTGFSNADLTATNGTLSAVSSADGGITWTATLTPSASITDTTNLITLDNTGVQDGAGNAGTGITTSNNYAVDTQRPTATIVVADSALAIGETALVTITFSEAVTGFTSADLSVANGTVGSVSSADGGITWTATLTPTASITDATNLITLDNTGVANAAGNTGTGTTSSNNFAIDTARPTASIVVADSALAIGETSLVTITFSEAVTGFSNADLTATNGTLSAVSSADGGITWTATFTPTASITDATNLITLDDTGVQDGAGNTGSGTTSSNNYAVDTTRPTASIVVADSALAIGETALVTITFSEAVTGFTSADLSVANGTVGSVSSADGGITWTATFTPTASITDTTNLITLANTGVADLAGNAGTGTTTSNNYAVDSQRPTATIFVSDTALLAGETALMTVTFSEAVTGFTSADLTVANGTVGSISSADGGITWTATFTPTASVTDTTNLITLDNTGVADLAGNAGTGTTNSNNYTIDTQRPTASIVVADSALAIGETALVTITFSEAVTGFTNADLAVVNGTLGAVASFDGGITWTATFTPSASITDATNLITLDNTGVANAAGNTGTGTTSSNNYAVDTTRPTASIVVADSALAIGETSLVTITFSEAVTGFTSADLTVANGTVGSVSSADGGITWTATFTPTASITDTTNLITLDNTGVQDGAGNTGSGTTTSNNYAVDSQRPTATIVVSDTALLAGETALVTVTFSEAVTGFTSADLTVANGTVGSISSADGGITWTATFTPTASVTDTTNLITLDNTGVQDGAGNAGTGTTTSNNYAVDTQRPTATIVVSDTALLAGETALVTVTFSEAVTGFTSADLSVANGTVGPVSSADGGITWTATLTPTASITDATNLITLDNTGVAHAAGNTGTGTTSSNNFAIDTARPTASIVVADSALAIGETSLVTITFSEAVTGFSNADLTATNGTLSAVSSADGGITWTATLTPSASITDTTNLITLDNTGVQDGAGNAGTGTTTSNNYAVDTQRPTATIVVADGALAIGETSLVTITFNEAVTGFTNADLSVANGILGAVGSSDGGITWTATFTPSASITDATNLITLANTGVADLAGNAGTGTTSSNNYTIDTQRPTASIVVADSALAIGETSLVTITFSEAVTGFSNADLTVANGTVGSVSSSDGGITWTATLTPASNVNDMSNLIKLNNSGVQDGAGNTGSGTTTSNNYAVDSQRPTASIVVADSALAIGETALVTITFSEAVTGFSNADLTVANGTVDAVGSSDGGITWTATLTPSARITDRTNLITLDNTGVQDGAGNAGTGTTTSNNYAVDQRAPGISSILRVGGEKTNASSVQFTVTFTEAVSRVDASDFSLATTGTTAGRITGVTRIDGSTYAVTVDNLAGNGTVRLDLKATGTAIADATGNAISAGYGAGQSYQVDHTAPAVTSVAVPRNATYKTGQALEFIVKLNSAAMVDTSGGTPKIAVKLDNGLTAYADYESGSGTSALVFHLPVIASQKDLTGIVLGDAIVLGGGTIRDLFGNNLVPKLNGIPSTSGILIGNDAPTLNVTQTLKALPENASTTVGLKVASLAIIDADGGGNTLSLAGADAKLFEIKNGALWLKAGTKLDFETNPVLDVSVRLDDPTIGTSFETSKALKLNITDVIETVSGTSGSNTLTGTGGHDILDGKDGNDILKGGAGNDRLIGGTGVDKLYGGAGSDVFVFMTPQDSAPGFTGFVNNGSLSQLSGADKRDIVADFVRGEDRLDLSKIDANIKVVGDQSFVWNGTGNFSGKSGELIYRTFDVAGTAEDKTIVYGDVNLDGRADFQIELTGILHLAKGDFIL
ncbi:hypothetical protein QO002_005530 [Pararhizobium capsulatum DSM 1112]|uniref:DUF4347 domain-containing protein n=1 Tax=Pararhizobium capsulatum DSM 1112 TaxID=1121113 RepID=A0ABU0BYI8_9HYPH|nr:Ig-like domain-containing protein [Pararhizobium capsulatum]MDQ0323324.1 hypothetical protein [Pararhizobium capsulatum DSM 1112]